MRSTFRSLLICDVGLKSNVPYPSVGDMSGNHVLEEFGHPTDLSLSVCPVTTCGLVCRLNEAKDITAGPRVTDGLPDEVRKVEEDTLESEDEGHPLVVS